MGDAGEALVDFEDRAEEREAALEHERERRRSGTAAADPVKATRQRTLELGRADLLKQLEVAPPRRQEQIRQALADIDRRLAAL